LSTKEEECPWKEMTNCQIVSDLHTLEHKYKNKKDRYMMQ
jgi:hypothetical protein